MRLDPPRDHWSDTTYHGFAGGPRAGPAPLATRVRRRPSRRTLALAGVAAALTLGVGLGFLARPKLAAPDGTTAPAAAPALTVPLSVAPPRPEAETTQPSGRLEVLPPDLARLARREAPLMPPPVPALPAPAPSPAEEPAPAAIQLPPPAPLRASFDCATAQPGAEEAVCADPTLAAADRRLARAYRRVLESGMDPVELDGEQRDWLAIREDAASRSQRALAQVYAQRIAELDRMAAEGAP
jgi:uncharacterized protein YecT (DUF1311 family)